jgi:Protein of unknown function (DUF2786)
MTQNTELTKIKLKIKALAAKTVDAGCSEHEANQAMEMVGRLLEQYNLTMEEIDVREEICKTIYVESRSHSRGPIDWCVTALADLVSAKVWYAPSNKWTGRRSRYAFFGQESDLEMIQYLYNVIDTAIASETETFKQSDYYKNCPTHRKSASVSFARGMANRISDRLREIKKHNLEELRRKEQELYEAAPDSALGEEAVRNNRVKGTALIVLKGKLIEQEFKKTGVRLGNYYYGRSTGGRDWTARGLGASAGDKVNLSRPIGGNRNGGLIGHG